MAPTFIVLRHRCVATTLNTMSNTEEFKRWIKNINHAKRSVGFDTGNDRIGNAVLKEIFDDFFAIYYVHGSWGHSKCNGLPSNALLWMKLRWARNRLEGLSHGCHLPCNDIRCCRTYVCTCEGLALLCLFRARKTKKQVRITKKRDD